MTKLQKIIGLAAAFVLMVGLSACGTDGQDFQQEDVSEFVLTLDDGTKVPCVKIKAWDGIDCNWDKATRTPAIKP